ncbi:MAG: arsinothricin resistance N-acetyltransferase ArsN1 family B [Rhodanobacteraceae bacterium]
MPAIEFRVARADDASAIAGIYAPYVRDTIISFETEAPDRIEMEHRIERIGAVYPWLVAIADGSVVGYAYACEHRARLAYRWSVDAAVYLAADAQRRGIGRALYQRLFALLLKQGYVNAFAGITLPNAASVALHEAMGFLPIGVYRQVGYKVGAWHDVGWWQLVLAEPRSDPGEPVAFESLDPAVIEGLLA